MAMKSFLLINQKVKEKGYGRFLSYLLVKRWLEEKISSPNLLIEYSEIDFE